MWQLFNIEKDIEKITDDLEDERRSREGLMEELDNFEAEASKKKKEQAKYLKEIAQCEKRITERSNKLDKSVSFILSWAGRDKDKMIVDTFFSALTFDKHKLILCFAP